MASINEAEDNVMLLWATLAELSNPGKETHVFECCSTLYVLRPPIAMPETAP